jgi:chromosome segregation protein
MAKAQFAEHAYSIVSQGMIDRLLTVSNAERKDFFDEASGIKEMQIKRHQAFLKLERTKDHTAQAQTIIQEIEPRLKILARQVKKLEEREEVESELREIQELYYFTIYSKNKADSDAVQMLITVLEEKYRTLFKELENVQTELAQLAHVSSRQEVFEKLQVEHQTHIQNKNNLERELAILEGQMHTEYSQAGKQNINWLGEKIGELKQSREKLNDELVTLQVELVSLQGVLSQHKKRLEELQVSKSQLTLKISRLQNELLKDQSEQHYRDFSGLTAVKAVLDHRRQFGEIYGLVAELGEVDEEYRVALEVAAGMHLTSIVVAHEDVARKAIDYLRQERYGIATFLPLNKIQGRNISREDEELLRQSEVIGLALELVRFDEKFRNIFSFIFGSTLVDKICNSK